MRSQHMTLGRTDNGLITCRAYEDGDVVVCHGSRGNCVNMASVSGHGPVLNMCDRLDVPAAYENEVIQFVHDHTDLIQ